MERCSLVRGPSREGGRIADHGRKINSSWRSWDSGRSTEPIGEVRTRILSGDLEVRTSRRAAPCPVTYAKKVRGHTIRCQGSVRFRTVAPLGRADPVTERPGLEEPCTPRLAGVRNALRSRGRMAGEDTHPSSCPRNQRLLRSYFTAEPLAYRLPRRILRRGYMSAAPYPA